MILKSVEKPETNKAKLVISVEKNEFEPAIEKSYRKNAGKFNVQGFRKGKAPRRIIERIYGESAFYEDAINIAFPDVYSAAIKEAGISPVDQPDLELNEINSEGFTFTATVTTRPEVKLSQYKELSAEMPKVEVSDEDVEKELENRRHRCARLEKVDRPAKKGDTIVIDFEGFVDGNAFDGGKGEQHSLKLGSGQFIPGFEDQLEGVSAGEEREVKVTFPAEYHANELAGKESVFKVKVHDVKEELLPELDDELAKDISEFETLDALRADIRTKLETARKNNAEEAFEENLIDKLIANMTAEIPECMIEHQLDHIAEDFDYRLRAQGMTLEAYLKMSQMDMESFRKTFRDRAERQVKSSLALEEITKLENFEISAEEIEEEYKKLAEQIKSTVEEVKKYMTEDAIREDMIRKKAIELVKSTAIKLEPSEKKAEEETAEKTESDEENKKAE